MSFRLFIVPAVVVSMLYGFVMASVAGADPASDVMSYSVQVERAVEIEEPGGALR